MATEFNIIANTMVEPGMSGGNRIFIENAKIWAESDCKIKIFTSRVGQDICLGSGLSKADFVLWLRNRSLRPGVFILYVLATFKCCWRALFWRPKTGKTIIWATSDYWPDALPAFIMKWKNKQIKLIGSLFLFAPNPLKGFREQGKIGLPKFKNIIFYLSQKLVYWLIKKYADMIFVTSEPDKDRFVRAGRRPEEIVVIQGGVHTKEAQEYLASGKTAPKVYDACFVGRFHPQKGVLELIEIWHNICQIKPKAKLAIIGIGELENQMKDKVKLYHLENNISFFGFLDGLPKYEIFKKSKIILHPAVYDSGGMAACEGMAWGLPGVGFNLEALKTYYPKGMLKAPIGDLNGFTSLIIELFEDEELYRKISLEAAELGREWDWGERAKNNLKLIQNFFCFI